MSLSRLVSLLMSFVLLHIVTLPQSFVLLHVISLSLGLFGLARALAAAKPHNFPNARALATARLAAEDAVRLAVEDTVRLAAEDAARLASDARAREALDECLRVFIVGDAFAQLSKYYTYKCYRSTTADILIRRALSKCITDKCDGANQIATSALHECKLYHTPFRSPFRFHSSESARVSSFGLLEDLHIFQKTLTADALYVLYRNPPVVHHYFVLSELKELDKDTYALVYKLDTLLINLDRMRHVEKQSMFNDIYTRYAGNIYPRFRNIIARVVANGSQVFSNEEELLFSLRVKLLDTNVKIRTLILT
jgi:hypothetical protein